MEGIRARGQTVSGAFVFLLLGVFAVFSTLMVLLSAQFYRASVEQTRLHNEQRVLCSYLMNVVRAGDAAGAVTAGQRDGIDVLTLGMDEDGERYETHIYCYGGALRELFMDAEQPFEPEYGEVICRAQRFTPELGEGGLLTLRAQDGEGVEHVLHVALHGNANREEAQR